MTDNAISGDGGAMPRRAIIAGLAGMAAAVPTLASVNEDARVYRLIADHKAATATVEALPITTDDDVLNELCDVVRDLATQIEKAKPSTAAGAVALIDYTMNIVDFNEAKTFGGTEPTAFQEVVLNVASFLRSMGGSNAES